jgi:hypothetical protein
VSRLLKLSFDKSKIFDYSRWAEKINITEQSSNSFLVRAVLPQLNKQQGIVILSMARRHRGRVKLCAASSSPASNKFEGRN